MESALKTLAASSRFTTAVHAAARRAPALNDPIYLRLMAWQFTPLVDRLVDKEQMPVALACKAVADMKRFMYICATNPPGTGRMSPPEVIDLAWHHFILFTREYAAFCDEHFGQFIHHTPFTRAQREAMMESHTERIGVQRAQDRAMEVFGDLSPCWFAVGHSTESGELVQGCADCEGSTNCGGNDPPCC